jgi:pimeloyl-ACP methyl ester carboxylesterase
MPTRRTVLGGSAALLATAAAGCAAVKPTTSSRTLALAGVPIEVTTYRPAGWAGAGILLHFHGLGSHPAGELGAITHLADRSGRLIVAPYFDRERFPFWRYQCVGILKDRIQQPEAERTGVLIASLIETVRKSEGAALEVRLMGHSAGGQFVERVAAFHDLSAVRFVAANPAAALVPSRDLPFPYGFGGLSEDLSGDEAIRKYLSRPLVLFVGELDSQDQGVPDNSADAQRQGATRLERARFAFEAGKSLAHERGWAFNWRYATRPGIGHNLRGMFAGDFGYDIVFGPTI